MRRDGWILLFGLWCASHATVAEAQQIAAQDKGTPSARWYGAPILIGGELAVAGLGLETIAALDGHDVPSVLWAPTLGAYLLTGPIVHLLNHEAVNAAASAGINVASPLIGFAIGFNTLMLASGCDNGLPHSSGPPCSRIPFWTFTTLGFVAAPVLDSLLVAHSSAHLASTGPGEWHPTFTPIVAPNGRDGITFGLGGLY
jgi:hypothetical protein